MGVQAKKLNLNATGSANVIQVQAEFIDEAVTNKLFAEKQMVFSGYTQGFTHRGTLKSKNHIVFKDGIYTGCVGSQTLAGCLLQNQSNSISEAGRLVAGLGHFQAPSIAIKDSLNFTGHYFLVEGTGDLITDPQSRIQVQYGAKLGTTGKQIFKGHVSQVGLGTLPFPYLEMSGLETFVPLSGNPIEKKLAILQKVGEIQNLQKLILPSVNLEGITLEGTQSLVVSDTAILQTPINNVTLKSEKLHFKGVSQSGFFEGLKTIVKAESAILEGVIKGDLLMLVDHYSKLNGIIETKL